jgi:catechol 2,3-dioxygenase-like lactoylglutathione lyase family enzyme
MSDVSFILLYVEDVARSAAFYAKLLEKPVLEESPGFAMLPAGPGLMLGLWRREGVAPKAGAPGGSEIAVTLGDDAGVDAICAHWAGQGVEIAQRPTRMDFGYTCVALDPDGHRIRAFAPAPE